MVESMAVNDVGEKEGLFERMAFIFAGNKNEAFFLAEFCRFGLVEFLSLGTEQDGASPVRRQFGNVLEAVENGTGHHYHSRPAAVRFVVHFPVIVRGEIPYVGDNDFEQSAVLSPLEYRAAQRRKEDLRKKCKNIYPHQVKTPR